MRLQRRMVAGLHFLELLIVLYSIYIFSAYSVDYVVSKIDQWKPYIFGSYGHVGPGLYYGITCSYFSLFAVVSYLPRIGLVKNYSKRSKNKLFLSLSAMVLLPVALLIMNVGVFAKSFNSARLDNIFADVTFITLCVAGVLPLILSIVITVVEYQRKRRLNGAAMKKS